MFTFVFVTTMAAALVVANAPIRSALALDLNSTLRGVDPHPRGSGDARNLLMIGEIGGAATLLVAAIALTRLPAKIAKAPPRFDARHVLALNLRAPQPVAGGWQSFHDNMAQSLATVTGVKAVAFASAEPVGDEATGAIEIRTAENVHRQLPWITVSPQYFDVFGTPDGARTLVHTSRGRLRRCGVSRDRLARSCARAVGECRSARPPSRRGSDAARARLVIGIVSDASSTIAESAQALMIYTPWNPSARLYQPYVNVEAANAALVRRVSSMVSEQFAGAVAVPRTVEEQLTLMTDAFQRIGEIVGGVAAITALLAIVGIYGVVALAARRRLKEMGIRLALGARRTDVYRAMVGPNVRPVVSGLVGGAVVATVAAIGDDPLLAAVFPVRLTDPVAFLIAALALGTAVSLAMLLPATRVTSVHLARVLREG